MKSYFLKIIIFFFIFSSGYYFHKFHPFPHQYLLKAKNYIFDYKHTIKSEMYRTKFPDWSKENYNLHLIHISKYFAGINIHSDRTYFNHLNDSFLENFYLIQLPRHNQEIQNFEITFTEDVFVLRILCDKNNNKNYKDWEKLSTKVAIIAYSCVHTDIVRKIFKKGQYIFNLDGPIATNPFFFKAINGNKEKFFILSEIL